MGLIATISFLDRPLAQVEDTELPYDWTTDLFWEESDRERVLRVVDRVQRHTQYDFGVIRVTEACCAALSIRISDQGAFQADCLLGKTSIPAPIDFLAGSVHGLRLQPILLPGLSPAQTMEKGRGLFARGLHYRGVVTRSNVSLLCVCDDCRRTFRLQPFHSGFAQSNYYYCKSGLHTLILDNAELRRLSAGRLNLESEQSEIERHLPPCNICHESFEYLNPLRCPHCLSPYVDFPRYPESRKEEYYGNIHWGIPPQRLVVGGSVRP